MSFTTLDEKDVSFFLPAKNPVGIPELNNKIVCLCGSTHFKFEFEKIGRLLALRGNIVLAPQIYSHAEGLSLDLATVRVLTTLHHRKILSSDIVLVIAPNNYIGSGTASDILFAKAGNIRVEIVSDLSFLNE